VQNNYYKTLKLLGRQILPRLFGVIYNVAMTAFHFFRRYQFITLIIQMQRCCQDLCLQDQDQDLDNQEQDRDLGSQDQDQDRDVDSQDQDQNRDLNNQDQGQDLDDQDQD